MEPLAPPGTEDEPTVNILSSGTKQEKERDRLLTIKAVLPSGKYGNVFELKYVNQAQHWYCNACACPVLGFVFHHESGKRHKMALGEVSQEGRKSVEPEEGPSTMQIAPGEPLPPGFEGPAVEKVARIQERLDVFTVGPLVALEYLLELKDFEPDKEPTYLCVLCDKKGDPRTVLTHLASYKHILQYLQKHFPTCYRALAPYMTKQYKRNWQRTLHGIAEAIEKKFGRLKPMPVDGDKYERNPVHYLELIARGQHFSELGGQTFEEMVTRENLTQVHNDDDGDDVYVLNLPQGPERKKSPSPPVVANPKKKVKTSNAPAPSTSAPVAARRRSLSSVSSVSSSDLSDFNEPNEVKPKRSPPPFNRGRPSFPPGKRFDNRRSPPPRREYPHPRRREEPSGRRDDRRSSRDRNLLPWEKSNYKRPSPHSERVEKEKERTRLKTEKMEEFRKLCLAIENDMGRVLKNHKKNPEKHPQYNEEWKKFWNRRYKELQAEGKDVSNHDFKPEWIEFWNQRMIELHQDELKGKKDALRKRLGLPEEPAPISFKIQAKKRGAVDAKSGSAAAGDKKEGDVIIIEDKDDDSKGGRSHSPWESDDDIPPARPISRQSRERPPRVSRDRSRSRSRNRLRSRDRSRSPPDRPDRVERISRDKSRRSYDREYNKERGYKPGGGGGGKPWERDRERGDYKPRPGERMRLSSELPWERERQYVKNEVPAYLKAPVVMRDVTRKPVLSPPPVPKIQPVVVVAPPPPLEPEEEENEDINVVAVLRLLTALEEKLGSLGPRVVDLLAQALAMEKTEANSSETLVDNEVNCVLFETIKEKLKGQLLAGLVEPIQERAFKKAIKKIAGLIHVAGERKKDRLFVQSRVDPVKVPGVGTVDKAAIARQIASALVLQGKTDVTQAELEQLINAVVGMAEASKHSSKPITTASFLEQMQKEPVVVPKAKTPPPPLKELLSAERAKSPEKVTPPASNSMEGLSDSDLQTLLQNFKDLSTEEQHGLINYLKKLESTEPDRVERLRRFVNLGGAPDPKPIVVEPKPVPAPFVKPAVVEEEEEEEEEEVVEKEQEKKSGRDSPFSNSNRTGSVNPTSDAVANPKGNNKQISLDSDEEDYSFEDVVKAVSKNVKDNELEKQRAKKDDDLALNLENTKALISNIMSNIRKSEPTPPPQINFNAFDLSKTLSSVNMANLANIVGSVQGIKNNNTPPPQPQPQIMQQQQPPFQQRQPDYMGFNVNQPQQHRANNNFGGGNYFPPNNMRPNVTYPNYTLYGKNDGPQSQMGQFGPGMGPRPDQQGRPPNNGPPPFSGRGRGGGNYGGGNRGGNYRW